VGDLCKRLYLAQSTVTELVSRAQQAGLVEASQSERDGRVSEIRLTGAGERKLGECFWRVEDERQALHESLAELDVGAFV
jgi:DNA-binding MarR family transcriptional regulator